MSPEAGATGEPGLWALIRADFARAAQRIGPRRVPVSEGFWLALDFRLRHWIWQVEPALARAVLRVVQWPFHKVVKAITRSGIGPETEIGPGIVFMHFGGVWIHPSAVIGSDCTIFQQVTITPGGRDGAPRIGDQVVLMSGAKVLGGVTIGDGARVGANAVVIEDVPAGALAVGNPARVIEPGE